MKLVILGLSITSSWGNGHATTYRSLVKQLSAQGHQIWFLERDVSWYRSHRDLPHPPYGETLLYPDLKTLREVHANAVKHADVVIVGSYVPDGEEVIDWVLKTARGATAFYDIDTPVTLAGLAGDQLPYLARGQVPRFDLYLSFTGGPTLERLERDFGARRARPLYCSVDPTLHQAAAQPQRWQLGYLGTYSEDRRWGVDNFLLEVARRLPRRAFAVAGPMYPDVAQWPNNVQHVEHVSPDAHAAFYAAQRFTLNVTRAEMVRAGYAPSVRLFEAGACGTPIISDCWPGLETILTPEKEILLARSTEDVLRYLVELPEQERLALGRSARQRVLREHSASQRAAELVGYLAEVLGGRGSAPARAPAGAGEASHV